MARYAEKTKVSAAGSREEIEATLSRYGADGFIYGWQDNVAVVGFRMHDRQIRFKLVMPDKKDEQFTTYMRGSVAYAREEHIALANWEQATRQRWRALALVIKAKLEAVEAGISEFENEFLANIVLPSGQLAGEWMRPQVAEAYRVGTMPSMLPMLPTPGGSNG